MAKKRLDILLFESAKAESREKAKSLIMSGNVHSDNKILDKPGMLVDENIPLYVKERLPYVSRGGLKLKKAVDIFKLNFEGKTVIDIGASTGGFTDLVLQQGAEKVYAVDVGKNQLHYSLTRNPHVVDLQKVNFREIDFDIIGEKVENIVCDVSFISLKMIIPKAVMFCVEGCELVFLIKPQFEAKKQEVGKNGVVRNPEVHKRIMEDIIGFAKNCGLSFQGLTRSPIKGPKGNIEYLVYFVYKDKFCMNDDVKNIVRQVVDDEKYSYCC